jgi:hypothetical protein
MTTPLDQIQSRDELLSLYPKLAARITHLREILTIPQEGLSEETLSLWREDVKSTLEDTMELFTLTAQYLRLTRSQP